MEVIAALEAAAVARVDRVVLVNVQRWCRSDLVEFGIEVWPLALVGRWRPRRNGAAVRGGGCGLFVVVRGCGKDARDARNVWGLLGVCCGL